MRDRQLAAAVPPEQLEQAVVRGGGEDRHPLRDGLVGERPLQPERRRGSRSRSASISGIAPGRSGRWNTTRWKKSPPFGVVGVLVERDDVALVAGDQRGHRRDDARLVGAVDDQAGVIAQSFVVHSHRVKPVRTGRGVLAGPVGRREEAAERVEVQLHRTRRRPPDSAPVGEHRRQVGDEFVGAGGAHQVREREAVLLHDHRVRADAEAAGEAEQPLDAGGTGVPMRIVLSMPRARTCVDPGQHRVGVERELGQDRRLQPLLLQRRATSRPARARAPRPRCRGGPPGSRRSRPLSRRSSAAARCGSRRTSPRTGPRGGRVAADDEHAARSRRHPAGARGTPPAGRGTTGGGRRCAGPGRSRAHAPPSRRARASRGPRCRGTSR